VLKMPQSKLAGQTTVGAGVQPYSVTTWSTALRAFNAGGRTSRVRFPLKVQAERRVLGEPVEHAGQMLVGVHER
jgi:hypothetical protein